MKYLHLRLEELLEEQIIQKRKCAVRLTLREPISIVTTEMNFRG